MSYQNSIFLLPECWTDRYRNKGTLLLYRTEMLDAEKPMSASMPMPLLINPSANSRKQVLLDCCFQRIACFAIPLENLLLTSSKWREGLKFIFSSSILKLNKADPTISFFQADIILRDDPYKYILKQMYLLRSASDIFLIRRLVGKSTVLHQMNY